MKKMNVFVVVSVFSLIWCNTCFGSDTHSEQAVNEASKAGSHASKSAAHSIAASGQVTSAASAIPLAIGGSAGAVSAEIAKDLMDAATAPAGTPLTITDEIITIGPPPDEALKVKANQ